MQRAEGLALRQRRVGRAGRVQRLLCGQLDHGVQVWVDLLDALQVGLDNLV